MSRGVTNRNKHKPNKKSVVVIGEGITEYYYLNSIKGLVNASIKPELCKDGLGYVRKEIAKCLKDPYDAIYCLIDMDNKKDNKAYQAFYDEYNGKIHKQGRKNEQRTTKIHVIESLPCLEIWFYYYFEYSAANYQSFENINPLKAKLCHFLKDYKKNKTYLNRACGLHQFIVNQGGSFVNALKNSKSSIDNKARGGTGAYTEMKHLFDDILKDEIKQELKIYQEEEKRILEGY